MAVEAVNQGGVWFWCVTESLEPTWRMTWDSDGIVQDFLETDEVTLNLAVMPLDEQNPNIFEAETRDELLAKVTAEGLYFDPAVET